ncbi:hypothetical protein ACRALDRAFT_1053731 [Sodiomyces alcalophilus JCM 7366]|uniref:uncharacterized protein n=1 Tax=Sodiomyces alcalophilus JCM 7366 TaxID=591952 RepID=UPI0039B693B4
MGAISAIIIVIITLFVPPIGVLAVAGCGMDFIVNILLTILGFLPGLIHALYVLYVYYDRREQIQQGAIITGRAPGIYSEKVQSGGTRR